VSLSLPLHSLPLTSASGINLHPGASDDGWPPPPPVVTRDGTLVQLLKDGEALRAAYEAIGQAKRIICVEVYIFDSDATGQRLADLLCRKAVEGVTVYLIYDSFGCLRTDRAMFQRMRRSGIRVAEFHPLRPWECRFGWRPGNRDHRKLVVVDGQISWLGGMNIADEYAGPWVAGDKALGRAEPWRDTAVGLRGPGTQELLTAYKRTWRYLQHGGRITRCQHIHDGQSIDVLATVACLNSPLRPRLKQLFGAASDSIDLTMAYFAPDDELVASLCAAAARGVRVRLMLPSQSDIRILVTAARSFYERLLHAGVQVFERQQAILHAKTMVIDGHTSVVGSTNLDYRSIEYNCELSVLIRSESFGRQMVTLFENDMRFANRIELNRWRRRPVLDRLGQWAVSRARYLL
jgi:cardiolipin synthase